MATLEWDVERTDGVTLVRAYVAASRARQVRIENCLDGPVWPPRRRGQPADGWDGTGGFEGVVSPDDRLVVGYATPAPPEDPPVELVSERPVTGDDGEQGRDDPFDPRGVRAVESTPAGVVRSLGDPVVPRDAVPVPDPDETDDRGRPATTAASGDRDDPTPDESVNRTRSPARPGESAREEVSGDGSPDGTAAERERTGVATPSGNSHPASASSRSGIDRRAPPTAGDALVVPGAVRAWLADVQQRVVAAERRSGDGFAGSTVGVATAADRRALARVGRRVEALLDRLEHVDPPDSDDGPDRPGHHEHAGGSDGATGEAGTDDRSAESSRATARER